MYIGQGNRKHIEMYFFLLQISSIFYETLVCKIHMTNAAV